MEVEEGGVGSGAVADGADDGNVLCAVSDDFRETLGVNATDCHGRVSRGGNHLAHGFETKCGVWDGFGGGGVNGPNANVVNGLVA